MPGPRRLSAIAAGAALMAVPAVVTAVPAAAETSTVTLVGSLQSELGCPADWQPDCDATHLARVGDTDTYRSTFTVPAGSYEYKVAINEGWDENYGAEGKFNGSNIPLVLEGPAQLECSYDDGTHEIRLTPKDLAGGTSPADAALVADSLRAALTRERFYFVMADRFANGSTANDTGGLTGGPLVTGLDRSHKG